MEIHLNMTHIFDKDPPGVKIPSPSSNPNSWQNVLMTSFSINVNTGATSNVYLLKDERT